MIEETRVVKVERATSDAVERLSRRAAVGLTWDEARSFVGPNVLPALREGEQFYLVRAVFPVHNARVTVAWWHGDALSVSAFGLGCAPYEKQPLVVPLDRKPAAVMVTASAAP